VRIVMLAAMAGLLIVALCVPQAFGDRALAFVVAYGVVRSGHIAIYLIASRDSPGLRRWVLGFSTSTAIVLGLLVAASFVDGGVPAALWWLYSDVVALVTARRLMQATEGRERNALARDSYSYLHFPMVAGIVLGALGLTETLAHVDRPLDGVHAFALLGGTAIY